MARFFGISNIGRVRANNQDRILLEDGLGLWVVADGMGGHAGGAEASRLACEAVGQVIGTGQSLPDAFRRAHNAVCQAQRDHFELAEMGTTLVAVLEHQQTYEYAWVGDSRLYRFNRRSAALERLTSDHNIAGHLLRRGEISEAQARAHPRRHVLTDCIGQCDRAPTIETGRLDWRAGDRLLLCSDGLSGEVFEERLCDLLGNFASPREVGEALLNQALDSGGRDNISLIVVDAPT